MALQKHLESRSDRPTVVKAAAVKKGHGTLKVNVKEGEVFLKNAAGKVLRLVWTKTGKRALPAGTYTLTGYRLVAGDWLVSTTGGSTQVKIKPGKTTRLALDPTIRVKLRAEPRKNKRVFLGMTIQNDRKQGVSIYHKGKRIPMPYRFTSESGGDVGSGRMNYG